jgi:hypothetical protein
VPASDRTELVTYVDSLRLPNPNLLNGRNDGSEPHPYLFVSRGAACNHCSFYSQSIKLVQQHIKRNHLNSDRNLQSWTQNGNRTYWAVDVGPDLTVHTFDSMMNHSPRRTKWLETLHEEERDRIKQDDKRYDFLDTGTYDEAFVGN